MPGSKGADAVKRKFSTNKERLTGTVQKAATKIR